MKTEVKTLNTVSGLSAKIGHAQNDWVICEQDGLWLIQRTSLNTVEALIGGVFSLIEVSFIVRSSKGELEFSCFEDGGLQDALERAMHMFIKKLNSLKK